MSALSVLMSNSEIPLYKQLASIISDYIQTNNLQPGDRLLSENEWMEKYNVSRVTVRKAMDILENDKGLITRSKGRGTYVAHSKSYFNADDAIGFSKTCAMMGKSPMTKLLERDMVFPTEKTRVFLEVAKKIPVLMTKRLHYIDGIPVSIETNYYNSSLNGLLYENLDGSLFEILNTKYGITAKHRSRTVAVCLATAAEAKLLDAKNKAPMLLFEDKLVDGDNRPLYLSKQIYCTDRMEFHIY